MHSSGVQRNRKRVSGVSAAAKRGQPLRTARPKKVASVVVRAPPLCLSPRQERQIPKLQRPFSCDQSVEGFV